MPTKETFELHPTGWETDPQEERFKLSTADYLVPFIYMPFAVFFRVRDGDRASVAPILKAGLERTLSQTRHLCGTIEKDADGGYSFVKRRDSTVPLVVQHLDGPDNHDHDHDHHYPCIDDLEAAHFRTAALGDVATWTMEPMTYGHRHQAESQIAESPRVAAFQANFVRGGLVFVCHHHHAANDAMGWAGMFHQLAENCAAFWRRDGAFPAWDRACLDLSRITKPPPPEADRFDAPPAPGRHPDHAGARMLLFHLPKSRAAALKRLASPPDAGRWISTYDAFMAHIWRSLTRVRAAAAAATAAAALPHTDATAPLMWAHCVDMRRRLHSPPVAARMQQNVLACTMSSDAPFAPLTMAEVVADGPLHRVAGYIRRLTDSTTQEALDAQLAAVAPVRDKAVLAPHLDSFPPLSNITTDWRDVNVTGADFGFARPLGFRVLFDVIPEGLCMVYPPRPSHDAAAESDEGNEFVFALETDLLDPLLADPEWCRYFEFRGIDSPEPAAKASAV